MEVTSKINSINLGEKKLKRVLINDLVYEKECKIAGFVDRIRDSKNMIFVILKDISGSVQVTIDKKSNEKVAKQISTVIAQSVVSFIGKCVASEYVKFGGREFIPSTVKVESVAEALPIMDDASIDQKLNYRWLDLRSERNTIILKTQSVFVETIRAFLLKEKFLEIHSPKLIATASESGSDVFEVKYFDGKAYLAQSPQFYKQMAMASGLEKIFECGPVFRAEQSFTNRHATEFTSFDIEFSYIESYEEVMSMQEDMLIAGITAVKERLGEDIKRVLDVDVVIPTKPFPKIKLFDLYSELEKMYGYKVDDSEKGDTTTECEKLCKTYSIEKYGHEFLFITDFAKEKRAFYHMRKDGVPQGYDLIWKGVEITTGAMREHRYDFLKKQAKEKGLDKDVEFYLEFFKYGCPPHGGFGMGVDRVMMVLLNIFSVKEIMYIFRGPNRLAP